MKVKVEGFGEDKFGDKSFPHVKVFAWNDDGTTARVTLPREALPGVEEGKEYDIQLICARAKAQYRGGVFVPVGATLRKV